MLRHIFRFFCFLTLTLTGGIGFVACSDDNNDLDLPQQLPESGFITLSLKCIEGTRADYTEEGVEGLNENLIRSVTICLWSKGGDKPDDTATPDYVQTFSGLNEQNTVTVRIPLTVALQHKLFESSEGKCHAFAAVNVAPPTEEFTIAEFRSIVVESTFSSRKSQDSFTMDGDGVVNYNPVTNAASGSIDLQRSASKITLALAVDDIVEQNAIVDGALVKSKWKSDTNNMRVWLYGGLAESTLDPDMTATPKQGVFFNTPDNLTYTFKGGNTDNGQNPPVNGDSNMKYPFGQDVPFYTYPHRWTDKPDDYAATYMILSVPWMQVDEDGNQIPGSTWRTCYYQVPVIPEDSEQLELVRNTSYHIYLHVGLLGSFEPDVPIELDELEYSAAQWGNVDIDVTIPDVRYLVVDQNDYTVNNETSIAIPFYTSHETIVTDATMTFYRYNFDDVGREMPVPVTMAKNEESMKTHNGIPGAPVFTADFNNETKELLVSHDLVMYEGYPSIGTTPISFTNNDGPNVGKAERAPKTDAQWQREVIDRISYFRKVNPSDDEYSRVEFKITLQHKDMKGTPNFQEVITITQYPGMYITRVMNYCQENVSSFSYTGAQGNTIINGNYVGFTTHRDDNKNTPENEYRQGTLETYNGITYEAYDNNPSLRIPSGWMTSIGLSTDNLNFNPNMYLVTVTTLPQGTQYRIGDPRSNDINNYLGGAGGDVTAALPQGEILNAWTGQTYNYRYYNGTSSTSSYSNRSLPVKGFSQQKSIYPTAGATRTLRYYYPTQEDGDHKWMIAPKFRICSSYAGTTWILNRELARRRAAAYQERGYAAGRWRLPTYGEVAFVMELAASYKIPRLFGTNGSTWWYWCAQGLVTVPSKQSGKGPALAGEAGAEIPYTSGDRNCQRARFVYDEWYWGEEDLKASGPIGSENPVYTFTWGDKPF